MAVEMCKLSLWLVSLDRDLPFSFVDDKVFLGNSLLGLTSLDQLRKLHIDPHACRRRRSSTIFDVDIDAIIRKAVDLRERLATEIDEDDPARTALPSAASSPNCTGSPPTSARSPTASSPPGCRSAASPARRSTRPTTTCASP